MKILKGNPVSRGIALGNVFIYRAFTADVHEAYFEAGYEKEQLQKYRTAVTAAEAELNAVIEKFSSVSEEKAKIFAAHKEILTDEEVVEGIEEMILQDHTLPDYAVDSVFTEYAVLLSKAKDPLIAARAADLRDVRNRVLRILHGEKEMNLANLTKKVIVVAHDLLPSDTATLDRDKVVGIITEVGGATSHTAIIARSYRIPAVLGISEATDILEAEPYVILDALGGKVMIEPDPDTIKQYKNKLAEYEKEERETREYLTKIPLTASGEKFNVGLNIGSTEPDDGFKFSDFVGLFRTEFLYMESEHMPTEDEQVTAYRKVLANAMGNPVTLRTLDIGGDKSLRYLTLPHEDNPFLGNRALRLCLSMPELFRTQLRAALRASAYGDLWIMFPMVGTIDDVRKAKAKVEEVKNELRAEKIPFDENIKVGIMIEIPSVAVISDMVAKEVDFASVGTNDLTQYTHAVDRMNANIVDYYQSMSPAMFRLLAQIFSEFNKAGKPISVCGELAGDPVAAVALVGLGLKKLSMNASNIARVKWVLSKFTMDEMKVIGEKVQQLPTQADILAYLKEEVKAHV